MKRRDCLTLLLGMSVAGGGAASGAAADWNPFSRFSKSKERAQTPDEGSLADEFKTGVQTKMLGEYTTISGLHPIVLEGVGLVVGLDRTGGDPPPSMYRTALLDDMRKRGVENPNSILQSPNTALVAVRAYLPPLIRKGDRFDVEVRLPDNGDASSLAGGYLLETHLSEQAIVPGRGLLKGHGMALAKGPVLIGTGNGDDLSSAGVLRRGRVLGGGTSLHERDMALYLRSDFRSVRNAKRIAVRIGERFHQLDKRGLKMEIAEAKTDQKVDLKIIDRYRDNFPRYLQVIRNISFNETPVAQRLRVEQLKDRLNQPEASLRAALELEAIGESAIPILRSGLKHPRLEVQFHSAVSLAYMGDASGLKTLERAAREEPAFRIFAIAALAAIDDAEASLHLRKLLNETGAETRYGAFRALTTTDPFDPLIKGERFQDDYSLHVMDSAGPPMVHLTHKGKAEIVLFGREQRLQTPLVLRAGKKILVNGTSGGDTLTVTSFLPDQPDQRKVVSTKVADVLRAAAELGATYPDLAQLLMQADKQQNLPGRLEMDALPRAGRLYTRPAEALMSPAQRATRIGQTTMTPNLFSGGVDDPGEGGTESEAGPSAKKEKDRGDDSESADKGEASLSDVRTAKSDDATDKRWYDVRRMFRKDE